MPEHIGVRTLKTTELQHMLTTYKFTGKIEKDRSPHGEPVPVVLRACRPRR